MNIWAHGKDKQRNTHQIIIQNWRFIKEELEGDEKELKSLLNKGGMVGVVKFRYLGMTNVDCGITEEVYS